MTLVKHSNIYVYIYIHIYSFRYSTFINKVLKNMKNESPLTQAVELANREFIKGFIFGQLILCLLIFFLLKTFLLKGSQETRLLLIEQRTKPLKQVCIITI